MGASPPVQHRHPTPDPTPSLSRMPPVPPAPIQGTQRLQTGKLPAANAESHIPLPTTQHVNLDAVA
jgi:hypothetical protein